MSLPDSSPTADRPGRLRVREEPIHGRMNRTGQPTALEVDGQLHEVRAYRPRLDISTEAAWRKEFWSTWDVELENGMRLTVYRNLVAGGWFRLTPIEAS